MDNPILVDNQPISATFFGEGKWLTEFITPNNLEVQTLHESLTKGLNGTYDRLMALHQWVASAVRYTRFVKGRLSIEGKVSEQDDLWVAPSVTARIKVGNCATKSFLLASLIRQELPPGQVHCVLGNLYNGKTGGHAWVEVNYDGVDCILESTQPEAPMVIASKADRYEAVHLFNEQEVRMIEGRSVLEPFTACFSTWLKDYLDWSYIEGRK